jgi:hypothetical protein
MFLRIRDSSGKERMSLTRRRTVEGLSGLRKEMKEVDYLRVKDEFWPFKKVEIPYCDDSIGLIQCCRVFVV